MAELSEQQRRDDAAAKAHLIESGMMLLGGIAAFWLVGIALAMILVMPRLEMIGAMTCR